MEFIRAYHDEDLFPIGCSGKDAKCAVTLVIEYNGQSYNLGFTVSKVSNIDDAYLHLNLLRQWLQEFKVRILQPFLV